MEVEKAVGTKMERINAWGEMRRFVNRAALRLTGDADTLKNLEDLKRHEWLPRDQVDALQKARLERLLAHAWSNVPYYRRILAEAGVVERSGQVQLDRFSDIPLLDKFTLHNQFSDLKSEDLADRKWFESSSGGSTGDPAHFILDQDYANWGRSAGMLFDWWAGYAAGDRKFLVWSILRDISAKWASIKPRAGIFLRNETWMRENSMSPEQMRKFLRKIQVQKPAHIFAYPENLYELSRFAEHEGLPPTPPKAIMIGGATLLPHMRRTIEKVFRSPVFDRYGSREIPGIACECEAHAGLHVFSPIQYLEILRPDGSPAGPGEIGEVVLTPLMNFAMPLIRYRIGDLAAWSDAPCPCGRAWPLLREVAGRTRDLFLRRDGTRIRIQERIFHAHRWIRKFQVVQEDYEFVRASIIPYESEEDSPHQHAGEIREIESRLCQTMGPECAVEVVLTDHIAVSASGKFRHTISKVW